MSVTFIAQGANFRAVLRPPQSGFDAGGSFVITKPEHAAEFVNGLFTTDDEFEIERLKSLPSFGQIFWVKGEQPGETQPSIEAQLSDLVDLATNFDEPGIVALLEGEEALHNRQVIVRTAQKALEAIREAAVAEVV